MNPSDENPQNAGTNEPVPTNDNVTPSLAGEQNTTPAGLFDNLASAAPAQTSASTADTSPSLNGPATLPPVAQNNGRPKPKKPVIVAALAGVMALLLVGGAVFGWYLPNRPENVWATGLDRSGQAVDKLVTQLTDKEELKKYQNTEITANVDVKSKDGSVQGSLATKFSKNKADGNLDVNVKLGNTPEKKLALQFLTELPEGKSFPNSYFKLTGLNALGLDSLIGDTKAYEDKWIAVTSEYLESIGGLGAEEKPTQKENVSSEEVASLIRTVSDVNNEYLFTNDSSKAVLVRREFTGKEILEGMRVYRYKVSINKTNAKQYCKVLSERVLSHPATKKITKLEDKDIEEQKKAATKDCDENVEKDVKENEYFDMWIDAKYKLIHKVRLYDEKDATTYTDIGQIYKGGDQLNFFVTFRDEKAKTDAKFTLKTDTKTNVSSGEFTFKQADNDIDAKVTFEAKPFSGEVKVEKPAGAINIQDLLKSLGLDPVPTPNPRPTSSPSTES